MWHITSEGEAAYSWIHSSSCKWSTRRKEGSKEGRKAAHEKRLQPKLKIEMLSCLTCDEWGEYCRKCFWMEQGHLFSWVFVARQRTLPFLTYLYLTRVPTRLFLNLVRVGRPMETEVWLFDNSIWALGLILSSLTQKVIWNPSKLCKFEMFS